MKIAINVLPLSTHIAGAQRYTKSIIEGLVEIDTTNDYYLILSPQNAQHYGIKQANVHNVIVKVNTNISLWRIVYEQCILPLKLKRLGINVLFSPCNIAPFWKVCRYVTMIFDMHWFIEQKNLAKYRLIYIKTMIRTSAKRSDIILTISESSKNDILYFTGVDSQKVVVTFLGATPLFDLRNEIRSHSQIERIREEKAIYKDYILCIGQVLPRKNVELLIKAMEQMRTSRKGLYFQYVIAGSWGVTNDAYQTVVSLIRESSLEDDVVMVNHPDDRIVADLLAHARLFVYPSRYEGYGLPVAELSIMAFLPLHPIALHYQKWV